MAQAPTVCPACGAECGAAARFCSECGNQLGGEREARKVLTALFADIVGSTTLAERLDPEDFQALVGGAVRRISAAVESYGGSVERIVGDGVLALFGAPASHEDDPERAVLAGLRIVEEIGSYGRDAEERFGVEGFAVRVGIETGLAVLGSMGAEQVATGDVLNTAARLQDEAAPGTVLVGERTGRLIEAQFEWGEPRELELKGKAEHVAAREARGPGLGTRRRGPTGVEAPLVGREGELELCTGALERLAAGRGGVLLVTGEAGMGKSRLVAELRGQADKHGQHLWLEGRCVSYGEALPYLPFRGMLRDWLGVSSDAPATEVAAALDERVQALLPETAEDAGAFLAPMLGLTPGPSGVAAASALHPDDLQRRTFEALAELLRRLAHDRPIVLVLDDLHWADGSSAALVEFLLRLTTEIPVLLTLTARPERDSPAWQIREVALRDLPERTGEAELLALPLEADEQLLNALVGAGTLPPALQTEVLSRAEGNPFYLEEIVRSLADAGALVRDGDRFRFEREAAVEVPESVEKVILARVDRLPRRAGELLAAASVIGRRFSLVLLEGMAGGDGGLDESLEELRGLDLVRELRGGAQAEYGFKHSLIQEVAYGSMLRGRREELHRRAAAAMERQFEGRLEERYGLLAHHYSAGGELERALDYHARAGERALDIYAVEETLEHYNLAVEAAEALALDEAASRHVLRGRARARSVVGDGAGATADLRAALAGARAAGDRRHEMTVLNDLGEFRAGGLEAAIGDHSEALLIAEALDDRPAQVHTLARMSIVFSNQLRLREALDHGRRALALAEESGDVALRGDALDCLKLVALQLGDLARLEELADELIALQRDQGNPYFLSWALAESSYGLLAAGDFDEALGRADEAVRISNETGERFGRSVVGDPRTWIHRSRGDYALALASAWQNRDWALEIGRHEWIGWTTATLGWVLLDLHAADEAEAVLQPALAEVEATGTGGTLLRCVALLALAERLRGQAADADDLLARGERLLADVSVPEGGAWLWGAHAPLALARVHLAAGRPEEAEALAGPLLVAAQRFGWLETASAAGVLLARCRAAAEDFAAARSLLEPALSTARSTGLPAAEWEAHAALASTLHAMGESFESAAEADAAHTIVRRIAAGVPDEAMRNSFEQSALGEIQPPQLA